jgi:hypothetical protein
VEHGCLWWNPECLGLAALLDEECPEARNPNLFIDRLAQGIAADGAMSTPTLGVLYATGYAEGIALFPQTGHETEADANSRALAR